MSDDEAGVLPAGVRVTGGRGGTLAHLADLDAAAAALDRAAEALEDAALAARDLSDVVDDGAVWSPGTAGPARATLDPLRVDVRAARTRDAAAALRTVVAVYRSTDDRVAADLATLVGGTLGDAGPLAWLAATGALAAGAGQVALNRFALHLTSRTPTPAGVLLRALGSSRIRSDPGLLGAVGRACTGPSVLPSGRAVEHLTPGVAAFLRSAPPGSAPGGTDPFAPAARVLLGGALAATALLGTQRTGLVVVPVVTAHPARTPADRGAVAGTADVLREVGDLYPLAGVPVGAGLGGVPGTVAVRRLDHADGARSWVVAIPGTQEWSPVAGANPLDLRTNLELSAGVADDASRLVVEAMTHAGIAPGEPVLLAGHSQGGMVAMSVAADAGLADDFSVAAVVTAGSPVAGTDLPAHVQALHLEHQQDYVWTLDGAPNPEAPNRTTVAADLTASPAVENRLAAASPVSAHDVAAYARTAEEVTGADHPSLRAFQAVVAQVLGDGTAEVTTRRYLGVRVA